MVSRMNNYPQDDLDLYNDHFVKLIEWIAAYLPKNFIIKYSKIRDVISYEDYWKKTEEYIEKHRSKWDELPEKERES